MMNDPGVNALRCLWGSLNIPAINDRATNPKRLGIQGCKPHAAKGLQTFLQECLWKSPDCIRG